MSTENEEQHSVLQPEDVSMETSGKPKMSYTIEFLLSLGELEVCKKLPDGFDKSLLSEFENTSYGTQDRQRALGSSPLQGFRRTDYGTGSSPPARGDAGNYLRGINKWDSRSSGRSDTDSDSESGRRFGSQARKAGQNSEHDGLLGSGSFPRTAGFASGASVPRFRPNGSLPISKSNEPYQPPRPYKAVPHSRRETNDSFNDETFGSTDSTGEDRAEEEKKRRAEFELMRKEQQKVLQEKQKSNSGKLEDPFSAIARLSENSNDRKVPSNADQVLKQVPIPLQGPPSRPLVPPGFVNNVVDKSYTAKALVHGDSPEVGKFDVGSNRQDMKSVAHTSNSTSIHSETTSSSTLNPENLPGFSSAIDAVDTFKESSFPDVSEVLKTGEYLVPDSVVSGHKLLSESGRSTSILDKLFGNTSASSGSASKFVEDHDPKTDDIGSPNTLHSKFARWFLEEDTKPLGDTQSETPGDLLSMIGGGVNFRSDVSDVSTMLGHTTSESESEHTSAEFSVRFLRTNGPPEPKAAVLTCEDLEQSILSEVGGNSCNSQPPREETLTLDGKVGTAVDNQASHHLLSLLQRGMGSKSAEQVSFDEGCDHEVGKVDAINDNTRNINADGLNGSGKTLTLESLFGTAFMTELHCAHNTSASEPFPFASNDIGSGLGSRDGGILASNDRNGKLNEGHWLGFHDSETELEFSNTRNSAMLPDLISYDQNFLPSSSNTSVNVMNKLAMLGGRGEDERSMRGGKDPSFMHGPYDMTHPELPFQNLHPQSSFHGLDSHPAHFDPHLKFMPPPDVPMHRNLEFDRLVRPPMLQQMPVPPQLVRGPMPPHPGYVPFGQRQPHFGGSGMVPPGGGGNNTPEAFQRMLEMELRANPNQIGHMYGRERDIGFRYR